MGNTQYNNKLAINKLSSWAVLWNEWLSEKRRVIIISDYTVTELQLNQSATVLSYCVCYRPNELTLLLRTSTTRAEHKRRGVAYDETLLSPCPEKAVLANEGLKYCMWDLCYFSTKCPVIIPTYPTSWPLTGAWWVGMLRVSWPLLWVSGLGEEVCVYFGDIFGRSLNVESLLQ